MKIKNMFKDDINRNINGVVKVDQDVDEIIVQELEEYVITKELKKHFKTFFEIYSDSFNNPTNDIGVWISGFFGSGKSHFLKILSYLLENREVCGKYTIDRFESKFSEDPGTFELIKKSTNNQTDTILFNIDSESDVRKDDTAVLRVFAKVFYKYLGYYGENLKIAKLERFLDKQNLFEKFREVFKENSGMEWYADREAYSFYDEEIITTMVEVMGIEESSARSWYNSADEDIEMSISKLVREINEYVESKPSDFRLLFMIDEVGQYTGSNTSLLLNLQTLLEKIGTECKGKVWVMCTGQESIDEIIKARENEFSRIQARFKTRLSLTSSSADEVIQKRILTKNEEAKPVLKDVFNKNESIMRNLFSFNGAILDIKGYSNEDEFINIFPFVPYQFIIMQKVFSEIRKHGNTGKHLSGGERSMLSGFQESAIQVEDKDEYSIVPFYMFYDTTHTFLDGSIRRVIERCQNAADDEENHGIKAEDVKVLKLLYLLRYVDDIPCNIDNIAILMADNINVDKITVRDSIKQSLNRLLSQNYIARSGDVYNFLTDEEQDVAKEIKHTSVDTSSIVQRIGEIIFEDIFTNRKRRYGLNDFAFDRMVDDIVMGMANSDMKLKAYTIAKDTIGNQTSDILIESKGNAIVVLANYPYFENLEQAMKIKKYIMQKNISSLPSSLQQIITAQQEIGNKYEKQAREDIEKAIQDGNFFADGEKLVLSSKTPVDKINEMLDQLISHVYSDIDLITSYSTTDEDINMILNGSQNMIEGTIPNQQALNKVEEYLEMQQRKKLPTSMADIQSRYQKKPYGWREIDIASVIARLLYDQKITIKYSGVTIQRNNPKLIDMLRKKSEIGKVEVQKRNEISPIKIRKIKSFMREYFDVMDIPKDEDDLIQFIKDKFQSKNDHYQKLLQKYNSEYKYPDKNKIVRSIKLIETILNQSKDNEEFIDSINSNENELLDNLEDVKNVEEFFDNQVELFNKAYKFELSMRDDLDPISRDEKAYEYLNKIRKIVTIPSDKNFNYSLIPQLNELLDYVKQSHDKMLESKREELYNDVRQCLGEIHSRAEKNTSAKSVSNKADDYFSFQRNQIPDKNSITTLEGMKSQLFTKRDEYLSSIDQMILSSQVNDKKKPFTSATTQPPQPKKIKNLSRQSLFPTKQINSVEEIKDYLDRVKYSMVEQLKDCDGFKIN
ncbi:MAG: BREX system P-loop protein BrxC [Finegoldia magna]|nr:BREX system P-loop protein BrxC [Finegoldia magna]